MTKAEKFHKNLQARREHLERLEVKEETTVAQRYELSIIEALDGFYDDEEDIKNMALAIESLTHLFISYIPSYADNT